MNDWPNHKAAWRVNSASQSGRTLAVVGWHSFSPEAPVGRLVLHISQRRALLITHYRLVDTLIRGERAVALGALVACAAEIARQLKSDLNVGDGCLEWQLAPEQAAAIQRAFPPFYRVRQNRPLKRGMHYLRLDPVA